MPDDALNFEFAITQDGGVVLDGVKVEEPQQVEASPVDAVESIRDLAEVERLRRENEDLREVADEYQSFRPIVQAVASGRMIVAAPSADPSHVVGYRQRLSTPGSAEVLAALNDFAATLPEDEKTALETNHEIFNRTFDKVAAHYRPPSQPPRINRKDIDKTLRRHEALVESARSLPSGVAPESTGDPLQWKELDTLKRRARRGHRDSEVQMARMLFVDGNDI